MAEARFLGDTPEWRLKNRAKFLLSGFVQCGVCGGSYIITNAHSYRCATNRDRGEVACSNRRTISRRRLEAAVLAALRERLYTRETLAPLIADVRDELRRLAADHERRGDAKRDDGALARVEADIEHVRRALLGGVTETTRAMLLDAEARRRAILEGARRVPRQSVEDRLASALDRFPALIERHLSDLAAVLAVEDVPRGK